MLAVFIRNVIFGHFALPELVCPIIPAPVACSVVAASPVDGLCPCVLLAVFVPVFDCLIERHCLLLLSIALVRVGFPEEMKKIHCFIHFAGLWLSIYLFFFFGVIFHVLNPLLFGFFHE